MDRFDKIKPLSIKGYEAFMSQMLIRCVYKLGVHLEVWRLLVNQWYAIAKSYLVAFLPPIVFSILLEDKF